MKFTVIFSRTITQTKEVTITAKDEESAYEKAETMVEKGISRGWEEENEVVEIEGID
jgi:hypothetical protein